MFTGITLHFLIEEIDRRGGEKINDIRRKGNIISIQFGNETITANFNPKYTHLSLNSIKGKKYFSTVFLKKKVKIIEQIDLDRTLLIKFEDDLLISMELWGRHSDCIFLKEGQVIESLKGFKEDEYKVPSPPSGVSILNANVDRLFNSIKNSEKIRGLTKGFIRELNNYEDDIIHNFCRREYRPCIFKNLLSPFYIPGGRYFKSMNEAITEYYREREEESRGENLRETIEREIDRRIKNKKKALENLLTENDPDIYRLKGEALLTYKNEIEPDSKSVNLDYMNKENLEIELDPSKSIVENAQKYFKRFKKEKSKREVARKRHNTLKKNIDKLKKDKIRLQKKEKIDHLKDKYFKEEKEEKKEKETHNFRVFRTGNNYKVLVGKGAESNHELTFSYARPYDIFLHVKNASGAHTILRVKDKNKPPPIEDIQEAAYYAAKFSKLKNASVVPVSYVEKRYVRSGKRLPTGKVILEKENTIHIRLAR